MMMMMMMMFVSYEGGLHGVDPPSSDHQRRQNAFTSFWDSDPGNNLFPSGGTPDRFFGLSARGVPTVAGISAAFKRGRRRESRPTQNKSILHKH